MPNLQDDEVLTEAQAAQALGISAAVLRSWRAQRRGPRFHKFGRSIRYLRRDVDAFIAASAVSPEVPPISREMTSQRGTGREK
jgi:predicted DNA-binding transcriptional regulator AlpA